MDIPEKSAGQLLYESLPLRFDTTKKATWEQLAPYSHRKYERLAKMTPAQRLAKQDADRCQRLKRGVDRAKEFTSSKRPKATATATKVATQVAKVDVATQTDPDDM